MTRGDDEWDGPDWLRDGYGGAGRVEVNTHTLAEFAEGLKAEVNRTYAGYLQTIRDEAAEATRLYGPAWMVFSIADQPMNQARSLLGRNLDECLLGLNEHVQAALQLAEVAAEVSQRYRHTDAYAAAQVTDVASLALRGKAHRRD